MFRPFILLAPLVLSSPALACVPDDWVRHDGPIYRDEEDAGGYDAASDGHIFVTEDGRQAMIYSGDDGGQIAIKLAFGTGWTNWEKWGVLLGPSKQPKAVRSKETAFYHHAGEDDHRIYFIGYDDEDTYESEIYMAQANALTGPWTIAPDPIMRRGRTDGKPVKVITSPSVVDHEGQQVMAYLGWNGFEDVTRVWSFVSTSSGDVTDWSPARVGDIPIGMEGQITTRPDGGYVAVATQETDGGKEGIFAYCAESPFGPWKKQPQPLLTLAGDTWEIDEIIAPSITYDPATKAPLLFYTAAEHASGWRMMLARPAD